MGLFFGLFFVISFYYGFFTDVENRVIDRQFQVRGGIPKSDDVVLVFITDDCLTKIASWSANPQSAQLESWSGDDFLFRHGAISWPWPRAVYARALNFLKQGKAKIIAFDVMFNEPSYSGEADDQIFANSIREAGNVVLPLTFSEKTFLDADCEMGKIEVPVRALQP